MNILTWPLSATILKNLKNNAYGLIGKPYSLCFNEPIIQFCTHDSVQQHSTHDPGQVGKLALHLAGNNDNRSSYTQLKFFFK